MVEESPPPLSAAEESIEAEPDTALDPEPESGEPTPEATSEPGLVCDCEEWMRSACKGLPFYKEHESRRYCVLHYPAKEKSADFKAALDTKVSNRYFDFRGVWFPDEVNFVGFDFGAPADFSSATFSANADFSSATLRVAKFTSTTFRAAAIFGNATFIAGASFASATFRANADFRSAKFRAAADSAADFNSATFKEVADFGLATFSAWSDFRSATFSAKANFYSATFSAYAYFVSATFSADASFLDATFSAPASFMSATFSARASFMFATFGADADFMYATFSAYADFSSTTFSEAGFNLSPFHAGADFSRATFNDSIYFFGDANERLLNDGTSLAAMALGKDPWLDLQHVRIEHPERIAFHTLNLRPHWFVNVDSRRFVFTDVSWEWDRISIKQEIAALESNKVPSPSRLLAITCRQLAENAEANNRYEEASRFRYWAMDLARRTKWNRWRFWKTDWLHMLYWAVSGYGERILRALGVLAAVWLVFALLYTRVGFMPLPPKPTNDGESSMMEAIVSVKQGTGQPLEFSRALTYSLAVMSLQKPEPKPLTGTAQTLVLLETILGPVQAALLALAIRRKFMR